MSLFHRRSTQSQQRTARHRPSIQHDTDCRPATLPPPSSQHHHSLTQSTMIQTGVMAKHRYIQPFNGPLSGTTRVSRYQKDKTNPDHVTEARDSEWQWRQLGHMQVCTSLQANNHASTPPLSFLQAGCPSCCPTNSVKALKAYKAISVILKFCRRVGQVKCQHQDDKLSPSGRGQWHMTYFTILGYL